MHAIVTIWSQIPCICHIIMIEWIAVIIPAPLFTHMRVCYSDVSSHIGPKNIKLLNKSPFHINIAAVLLQLFCFSFILVLFSPTVQPFNGFGFIL